MRAQSQSFLQHILPLCLKHFSSHHQACYRSNLLPIYDAFVTMSGHSDINHAHPATTADRNTDAHPTSTHPQSQLPPFHPANPPTGNSFGPYIFNGLTTNRPHPSFLNSLSNPLLLNLDVPNYLRSHPNSHPHNPLPCNNTTLNAAFRHYLCASLARHHSYKKTYLRTPLTNAMRTYRKEYQNFIIIFTTALESLLINKEEIPTPKQKHDLISLERTLTHETFALCPYLFDSSFKTNETLLLTTSLQAPSLLNILCHRSNPEAFLKALISNLKLDWIDLVDAADILDCRYRRYERWRKLEEEYGQLVERLGIWSGEVRRGL